MHVFFWAGKNPYQTPIYQSNSAIISSGIHYQQPHYSQNYHTLQPSTHYSYSHVSHCKHHQQQLLQPHPPIYARPTKTYENVHINSTKTELDRFFDQLGLDNKVFGDPLPLPLNLHHHSCSKGHKDDGSESPVFFSSVSSIDSCARKSGSGESEDSPLPPGKVIGARTVGAPGYSPPNIGGNNNAQSNGNNNNGPSILNIHHGEPSIVERNARVIKWLFNCRKAMDNR